MFIQPKFAYPLPSVLTTLFATLFLAAAPKPIPPNKVEFAAVPVVLSLPLNEVVTLPAKSASSPKDAANSFNVFRAAGAESTTFAIAAST